MSERLEQKLDGLQVQFYSLFSYFDFGLPRNSLNTAKFHSYAHLEKKMFIMTKSPCSYNIMEQKILTLKGILKRYLVLRKFMTS